MKLFGPVVAPLGGVQLERSYADRSRRSTARGINGRYFRGDGEEGKVLDEEVHPSPAQPPGRHGEKITIAYKSAPG
jgi:hypothetical protein